jgi:hypothetical protein
MLICLPLIGWILLLIDSYRHSQGRKWEGGGKRLTVTTKQVKTGETLYRAMFRSMSIRLLKFSPLCMPEYFWRYITTSDYVTRSISSQINVFLLIHQNRAYNVKDIYVHFISDQIFYRGFWSY